MNSATNQVVENQLVPMQGTVDRPHITITGQWFYENFVQSGEEQITKMGIVRELAKQASFDDVKKALKDAVEIAHKHDIAAGIPEKVRGVKRQSAMNARTVMQNAFGALRLAESELIDLGYTDKTGYQDMRVLAKQALDKRGVKWDGTKVADASAKEVAKMARDQKAETAALETVMKENPRALNESFGGYMDRIQVLAEDRVADAREAAIAEKVATIASKLFEQHGAEMALKIGEALQALALGTDDSDELTEAEADELLKAAALAEEQVSA